MIIISITYVLIVIFTTKTGKTFKRKAHLHAFFVHLATCLLVGLIPRINGVFSPGWFSSTLGVLLAESDVELYALCDALFFVGCILNLPGMY